MWELLSERLCSTTLLCPHRAAQRLSTLGLRWARAGGAPAEGERKEEKVPKVGSASGSSESNEETPHWAIFQSWLCAGWPIFLPRQI